MSIKRRLTIRDGAATLTDTRDGRGGTAALYRGGRHEAAASYRPGSELAAMLDGTFATGCVEPLLDWLMERAAQYGPLAYVARLVAAELAG